MANKSDGAEQDEKEIARDGVQVHFRDCEQFGSFFATCLGPYRAWKVLVGDGEMCVAGDGETLLRNIQVTTPGALFMARAALSHAKVHHDGICRFLVFLGELIGAAGRLIRDGMHPRRVQRDVLQDREHALVLVDQMKMEPSSHRRDLRDYVRSVGGGRLGPDVVDMLVDIHTLAGGDIERVEFVHVLGDVPRVGVVRGVVLKQGFWHDMMRKELKDAALLAINVGLEFEGAVVKTISAVGDEDTRERLLIAERKFVTARVRRIIELKHAAGDPHFLLVSTAGIDPPSLDILSRHDISAVRRVPRHAFENMIQGSGAREVSSLEDMKVGMLGRAVHVLERRFGAETFLFVELPAPKVGTLVLNGGIAEMGGPLERACRAGLRGLSASVGGVLPGAGATEAAICRSLRPGPFRDALLALPRRVIENAGWGELATQALMEMMEEGGGFDVETGQVVDAELMGVYDSAVVVRSIIAAAPVAAMQFLLVDAVFGGGTAHRNMGA